MIEISSYISNWATSFFGHLNETPWHATNQAAVVVDNALKVLGTDYNVTNRVAVHSSANVENGAIIKGPAIIGPNCFVAATAYLRDGVFLDQNCTIGPACELKSAFVFLGAKIAHLNFVGDTLIGSHVNIEAGAIIANYHNEKADKHIRIQAGNEIINTGVDKFGALIGDGCHIGANAVIAPGAILAPGFFLERLGLLNQYPTSTG